MKKASVIVLQLSIYFVLIVFAREVEAVDFSVNLTTDQHDVNIGDAICDIDLSAEGEQCSIRAATEQANNLSSNDRIFFNLPVHSTITLTTSNGGEIPIVNNGLLEIVGSGANNLTIDGGAGTNGIFFSDNAIVTISALRLTGGDSPVGGGAIRINGGEVVLDQLDITGNSETASGAGGGVVFVGGTHLIKNSTFSSNSASNCGGFYNEGGSVLTVINSTISGNTTRDGPGGGFCNVNGSTTVLRNVTVTGNTALQAGGIYNGGGSLDFGNTIIAGNHVTVSAYPEIRITDGGGNDNIIRRKSYRRFAR